MSIQLPDARLLSGCKYLPLVLNDTLTLLMTHSINLALDLSLLDLGPVQLFLMSENCRQSAMGLLREERPPNARYGYVFVCFRKASELLDVHLSLDHMAQ